MSKPPGQQPCSLTLAGRSWGKSMAKGLERIIGAPLTPAEYDEALRAALKRYRKNSGLTKAELASLAGVSSQQIQRYEAGTNKVSVSRLMQLSHAMGLPASQLVAEIEVVPETVVTPESLNVLWSSESGRDLIAALQRISDGSQIALMAQLATALARINDQA